MASKKHPATTRVLVEAIRNGLNQTFASKLAGITQHTLKVWRDSDPLFARELEAARAEFVQKHVGNIDRHSKRNWQASAWLLERTEARDFGPPSTQLSINQIVDSGPNIILGPAEADSIRNRIYEVDAKVTKTLDQLGFGGKNGDAAEH